MCSFKNIECKYFGAILLFIGHCYCYSMTQMILYTSSWTIQCVSLFPESHLHQNHILGLASTPTTCISHLSNSHGVSSWVLWGYAPIVRGASDSSLVLSLRISLHYSAIFNNAEATSLLCGKLPIPCILSLMAGCSTKLPSFGYSCTTSKCYEREQQSQCNYHFILWSQ